MSIPLLNHGSSNGNNKLVSSPSKSSNKHGLTIDPSCSPSKKKKPKFANDPSAFQHVASSSSSSPSSSPSASPAKSKTSVDALSTRPSPTVKSGSSRLADVDPRILESRKQLPIWSGKQAIIDAVKAHDTVVILGETGSGKTTQIPQYLYEAGFTSDKPVRMVGITQPRRVAATSLARRVAFEMGAPDPASRDLENDDNVKNKGKLKAKQNGPGLVGYSIRFDDSTSPSTRIKFMTDGMVLREMIASGSPSRRANDQDGAASLTKPSQLSNHANAKPSKSSLSHSLASNLLLKYSVLIIDEAHERTLRTDMVLGLAKRIQRERKLLRADWIQQGRPTDREEITELKIVVMSATLDANHFANFFGIPSKSISKPIIESIDQQQVKAVNNGKAFVPILYVKGRQHSVNIYHTQEPTQDWADSALRTILQIHVSRPPGDVLVFMTGQEEIESLAKSLENYANELDTWAQVERKSPPMKLCIAPLYAALGPSASVKVFAATPPNCRKVVLATNIAETSITISGIVYVIDCGLAKEKVYTPNTSVESLQTREISQSAARQRAGRAGRERSGECYRLYPEESFKSLPLTTIPEILRTDLAGAVLQLFAMGQDPYRFDWIDPPDALGLKDAVLQLIQLGALQLSSSKTENRTDSPPAQLVLTAIGQKMALLPVAPAYSRALISASLIHPKVARQVRDLIAILSADRSILHEPSDPDKRDEANKAKSTFIHRSGDHATFLNVLYSYLNEQRVSDFSIAKAKQVKSNHSSWSTMASFQAKQQLKAWCQNHYVHEKAIRNVLHIRKQLAQLCSRQGIICDDAIKMLNKKEENQEEQEVETEQELEKRTRLEKLNQGIFVTKKNGSDLEEEQEGEEEEEDYVDLRKCLLEGRFNNTALKTPEANTWNRIGGGQPFKIHPASTLHASRFGTGTKMDALLFEELVFTSQNFARTVSKIEPAWLQEIALKSASSQTTKS